LTGGYTPRFNQQHHRFGIPVPGNRDFSGSLPRRIGEILRQRSLELFRDGHIESSAWRRQRESLLNVADRVE
jgi:hypothetical protein